MNIRLRCDRCKKLYIFPKEIKDSVVVLNEHPFYICGNCWSKVDAEYYKNKFIKLKNISKEFSNA